MLAHRLTPLPNSTKSHIFQDFPLVCMSPSHITAAAHPMPCSYYLLLLLLSTSSSSSSVSSSTLNPSFSKTNSKSEHSHPFLSLPYSRPVSAAVSYQAPIQTTTHYTPSKWQGEGPTQEKVAHSLSTIEKANHEDATNRTPNPSFSNESCLFSLTNPLN